MRPDEEDRAGGRALDASPDLSAAPARPPIPPMRDVSSPDTAGAALVHAPDGTYRGPDRRKRPTPRLSRYSFFGGRRRQGAGPKGEEGSFVDRYGAGLFLTIAWVTLMNVGDSFFTLYHLQAGGIELNPIAQQLLNLGRVEFVLGKSVMISLALVVLCVHKNFGLARWGLWAATATYTALFGWHLYLLTV